jgi:hypothetical protein
VVGKTVKLQREAIDYFKKVPYRFFIFSRGSLFFSRRVPTSIFRCQMWSPSSW